MRRSASFPDRLLPYDTRCCWRSINLRVSEAPMTGNGSKVTFFTGTPLLSDFPRLRASNAAPFHIALLLACFAALISNAEPANYFIGKTPEI